MKYKLVIFDMDGTILDTLEDLMLSTNYIMDQYGYPTHTLLEIKSYVGNGIYKLIERAAPKGVSKERIDEMFIAFKKHYNLHCKDHTKPYDGIIELIKNLKNKGCKVAVVSNKAHEAVLQLSNEYFNRLFDISIGEREGIEKKPSPDSVNEVMKIFQMDKDETIYIGDSEVDIQTANNAGINHIIVNWGFREYDFLKENGAHIIVSSTKEIEDIIFNN